MRNPVKISVVILTGGRDGHQELVKGTGLNSKVLLPIGGKPMVQRVIETAQASRYQPEIFISTADPDVVQLAKNQGLAVVPNEKAAVRSFLTALNHLPDKNGWVLFISGDHPLLTTAMVDYFIEDTLAQGVDITAAMIPQSVVQARYPDAQRSYLHLKGDGYSGGNLYLLNQGAFNPEASFLEELDAHRKQKWKPIVKRLLSRPWLLCRFLLRQLTIHQLALLAEPLMGCRCGIVVMPWAECCMDVDKLADKLLAEAILAGQTGDTAQQPAVVSLVPAV